MKNLRKKGVAAMLGLLLSVESGIPLTTVQAYTVFSTQEEISAMERIAQSDQAELYLDEKDALLCLVDKQSGKAIKTKIMDGDSGNGNIMANQKSDFIISYWKDEGASSTTTQVNYTMAIENEQMTYEDIENGVRIHYTLKEDRLSMDCVPKYISEERMKELVLDHISGAQRTWLEDYYRLYNDYYVRTRDNDGVTQSVIREIYGIFYETGIYTEDDLIADNEAYDYESTWSNLTIDVDMEYMLDGGDLVVHMPADSIVINNEDVIVNSVTLLPYLLSASVEEEGYIVLPDGSGAVIEFNNGRTSATDYKSRVYGSDVLINSDKLDSVEYYANMPMIGMVYEDYAVLAIVENGESMAEINTRISGKVDNYNIAYFSFYLNEKENVATSSSSSVSVNKYTGNNFDEDIVLRYRLITEEEDCNYTGIAHAYQEYLIEQGTLTKQEETDSALVLELLGSELESKTFFGVPYKGVMSLTSFGEAEDILEDLAARGIKNADIQMDGWLEGGINHELLTTAGLESTQGSKKDFASLTETAEKLGYGFYPNIFMQQLNKSFDFGQTGKTKSYAKKYASRELSKEYAQVYKEPVMGAGEMRTTLWQEYLLSPLYLNDYAQNAVKTLNKYGLKGVTVTDLGKKLVADYNDKEVIGREDAMGYVAEAIGTLEENVEVAVKNSYQYAWKGVTKMTDLPSRSNEYTIFNYDIPLLQLVLDGCISYSTQPLNFQTQKDSSELLLYCIETHSNPKFYLMSAEMDELFYVANTDSKHMSINYDAWADRMTEIYQEYEQFCEKTEGSTIRSHERVSDNVKCVTYDNGVVVYVNYGDGSETVNGKTVNAKSYLVVE